MAVGANIRRRRYELGLSQQELADAMGYKTRSTIAKIESEENDVTEKKLRRFWPRRGSLMCSVGLTN